MNIRMLEKIDHGEANYNLQGKLWEHILKRSELCFAKNAAAREAIKTKEDLAVYAKHMQEGFIARLGGIPYDNTLPLCPQITGVLEEPGLRIEKIVFQSRPHVYVTANLYLPEKRRTPCGAVLLQMGHSLEGKQAEVYQRVARSIASAGLIVFAMDPQGQGERLSYFEKESPEPTVAGSTSEHQYTGDRCTLLGDSLARYFIADGMRAVDYLLTRPEVDGSKIGATGCSGGGTATAHMMVCDERIAAAAPAAFITSRQAYLYSGNPQDAEQIWLGATAAGFDHHEVFACFAPKPVLMLTCESDFFCIEGADEVKEVCSRFWELHGKGGDFRVISDDTTHSYTDHMSANAAAFFAEVLNGENRKTNPRDVFSIREEDLWCTPKGQVLLSYPDAKTVFEENRERWQAIRCENGAAEFIRERMAYARKRVPLRLRKLFPVIRENAMQVQPLLWFSQPQMPQQGLLFSDVRKTIGEIVVCVWDSGTDDLESHISTIRRICQEGKGALVVDLSGMGKCKPYDLNPLWSLKERFGTLDVLTKDLYSLGDSLCALRLFELEYVLTEVCDYFHCRSSLYAEGMSAQYARLLKIVKPELEIQTGNESDSYENIICNKYYEDYNLSSVVLPGIGKYL